MGATRAQKQLYFVKLKELLAKYRQSVLFMFLIISHYFEQ